MMRKFGDSLALTCTACQHVPMPEDDILTTREVAAEYGTTRRRILKRVADGDLDPLKKSPGVTGAFLFARSEAERVFGKVEAA